MTAGASAMNVVRAVGNCDGIRLYLEGKTGHAALSSSRTSAVLTTHTPTVLSIGWAPAPAPPRGASLAGRNVRHTVRACPCKEVRLRPLPQRGRPGRGPVERECMLHRAGEPP